MTKKKQLSREQKQTSECMKSVEKLKSCWVFWNWRELILCQGQRKKKVSVWIIVAKINDILQSTDLLSEV